MGTEIERKFLVHGTAWQDGARGRSIRQAYLCLGPPAAVRVRMAGGQANINIKQAVTDIERMEYEYPIPLDDAEALLANCRVGAIIEKTRYRVPQGKHCWEIDVFHGSNAGLVVAEIELAHREESFDKPPWLGAEVSADPRFLNVSLAICPFADWESPPPL